jgi:hypothetical protein
MTKILMLMAVLTMTLLGSTAYSTDAADATISEEQIDLLKKRALNSTICQTLQLEVDRPMSSSHSSTYESIVTYNKKYSAPELARILGVPYKQRSLETTPIPEIESLTCKETVETWRAMYEYKTIPYKVVVRSPFNKFLDDVFDWVGDILNYIFMAVILIVAPLFYMHMIRLTLSFTKKDSDSTLPFFVIFTFLLTSPISIAPMYFAWTLLGNDASFFTYFIGCLIFLGIMTFVYLIRKFR